MNLIKFCLKWFKKGRHNSSTKIQSLPSLCLATSVLVCLICAANFHQWAAKLVTHYEWLSDERGRSARPLEEEKVFRFLQLVV
jgi:hypothetical protein